MNLNSQHQLWSRWTVTVTLPWRVSHDTPAFFETMKDTHARYMRSLFGSTGQALVKKNAKTEVDDKARPYLAEVWTLDARVEGHPVHDPIFRDRRCREIGKFYLDGFGPTAVVNVKDALEAGDVQDGTPAAQLLIVEQPVLVN